MKQLYYVIQTLLHGRNANVIKIVSLGLGLMMSILLFSRVAYEQSYDTCFKDNQNLYQLWIANENPVISIKSEWFKFTTEYTESHWEKYKNSVKLSVLCCK